MMWETVRETVVIWAVMFGIMFVIMAARWVVASHFEAKTYTALTGKQVTTRQALWVQLRVIEPATDEER